MRSPVTAVINAFNSLTEEEKKLCLDFIAPEPEPEQPAKKPRKKRATKSAKAQSLENVIKSSHEAKADSNGGADLEPEDFGPRCGVCGHGEQYQDHFEPSPNYHPFDAPAQTATRKSRRRGAAASSTPSTETNLEGALAVGAGGD